MHSWLRAVSASGGVGAHVRKINERGAAARGGEDGDDLWQWWKWNDCGMARAEHVAWEWAAARAPVRSRTVEEKREGVGPTCRHAWGWF
ncbi:hypothetical protein PVAP13_5NG553086 [Panicum virgatum]|uniref:Uncharacterized protein n=1 Tax=Panicum virgatum TaxID=38727 RepID=A0A8T0S6D6_PANVG|nr:hypothetical protein PVAP13_5NG553086 [Panicum virgatum]